MIDKEKTNPVNESLKQQMKNKILRLPAVIARTGLSRSTIYLRISEGEFPKPISLGPRTVGWVETDISNWLEQKIFESRLMAPKKRIYK